MNYRELLSSLTPEIYLSLRRAVELGKWPDGNKLTSEQRQLCIEAVIAYEQRNMAPEERTGYVPPKSGSSCGHDEDTDQPLKWS